ncbi:TRADD-N-associated membrane domain-containing protein [Streptomyces avermitilis]|uniref:TRADD-N-associated membrane domain-containing protein n=1 Tax=Streptomyces avermitilis TaxID=33903 RepID=UPI0036CE3E40
MDEKLHQRATASGEGRVYQAGGDIHFHESPDTDESAHGSNESAGTLASQRQKFFFSFLTQSLRQSEITFRLSVIFMAGGAAIILTGGVLALVHAGNPNLDYLPLVTALIGALITTGGGALAIHSNRARKHVTDQADRIDLKIDEDHKLERARALIDRVQDTELRDRLNAVTAMRALDMAPDPETAVNHILPEQGGAAGEIEPGSATTSSR